MVRREPADEAAAVDHDDDGFHQGPPSIRTTGEIPAVTGEVRPRPEQPSVPEFGPPPALDRNGLVPPAPSAPGEPEEPPRSASPVSAPAVGRKVVTFPPTSAATKPVNRGEEPGDRLFPDEPMPGRDIPPQPTDDHAGPGNRARPQTGAARPPGAHSPGAGAPRAQSPDAHRPGARPPDGLPSGPARSPRPTRPPGPARTAPTPARAADEVPVVETQLSAEVRPRRDSFSRRPPGPSIAGAVEIGAETGTGPMSPEVFATETSVFPAVRTRRGDLVGDDQGAAAGSPHPAGPSLPLIRPAEDELRMVRLEEEQRIRRLRIGIAAACAVAMVALVALGSIVGLGLP